MAKKNTSVQDDVVEIEVESGWVPPTRGSGYVKNWPLEKLKVGESFFIPLSSEHKEASMRHALQVLCKRRSEEDERNYSVHKTKKNGSAGFRIIRNQGVYKAPQKLAA